MVCGRRSTPAGTVMDGERTARGHQDYGPGKPLADRWPRAAPACRVLVRCDLAIPELQSSPGCVKQAAHR
jgi:hypothetical protein